MAAVAYVVYNVSAIMIIVYKKQSLVGTEAFWCGGAFCYHNILPLQDINWKLNAVRYRDKVLHPVVRLFLLGPQGQNMTLQDDNATPNRARIIQETTARTASSVYPGPDLNPIEHL